VAHANDRTGPADAAAIEALLERGEISTQDPVWKDLWIGKEHFQVESLYGTLAAALRNAQRK
jgi:hypothetical protein